MLDQRLNKIVNNDWDIMRPEDEKEIMELAAKKNKTIYEKKRVQREMNRMFDIYMIMSEDQVKYLKSIVPRKDEKDEVRERNNRMSQRKLALPSDIYVISFMHFLFNDGARRANALVFKCCMSFFLQFVLVAGLMY